MIISRSYYKNQIDKAFKYLPIVILIGARQVGKTTIMQKYDFQGKTHYLNGQDPEIIVYFERLSILEKYLQANINKELKGMLLIDEFQFIPKISLLLKLITDKYPDLKVLCSGSSSLDIMRTVEESLAGRIRMIPVFSFSFSEYLKYQDTELFEKYQNYDIAVPDEVVSPIIKQLFEEYLIYGGMPRTAKANDYKDKTDLLHDIYQTYLMRDIRSFIRDQDFIGFNKMLRLIASQIGNLINVHELSNSCQLSYNKCNEYVELLEQMYIIKTISPFTTNLRKELTLMKKVFFTDLGLRNIIYNSFNDINVRTDNGALFENYIFLSVLRKIRNEDQIHFYRTKDGLEIDFILSIENHTLPIEVKFSSFDQVKSQRNLNSFKKIIDYNHAILFNKNLNEKNQFLRYLPGYFSDKVAPNETQYLK